MLRLFPTLVLALPLLASGLLGGCDIPDRPQLQPAQEDVEDLQDAAGDAVEILEPPSGVFEGPWEAWDVYYAGRQPMGYSHVSAKRMRDNRRQRRVLYSSENKLLIRQGNARILQSLQQDSTESNEGRLIDFHAVLQVGPAETRFEGEVEEGQLRIQIIRGTSRPRRTIPWQSTYRGPMALEQSLRRRPLTGKDERRGMKLLLPGQYELGTARLRCRGVVSVPMLDGTSQQAIEIDCEIQQQDGRPTFSTLWTDSEGRVVRSLSPALALTAYRADSSAVETFASQYTAPVTLAIEGEINDATQAERVAFRVQPLDQSTSETSLDLIPPAPGQFTRTTEEGFQQVLVARTDKGRQERWTSKGFAAVEHQKTDADTEPNFFVDSSAPLIRQLAQAAVGTRELSDREIAVEMAQTVDRIVASRDRIGGLVKASVVAQQAASDSTGRAIMLAALLRAREIPAKVALGLRLADDQSPRMLYHAWTLAWIEDRWVAVDAADRGIAAPDRLIFSTTDLTSGNEYEAMVPLLDAVGRISVELTGQQ